MMKKPYRNAIRSRQMIQDALIELLSQKPLEKITVVDLVEKSGLSRNTFYAHYQDVFAVMESFHQQGIQLMNSFLEEAVSHHQFDNPLPLLLKTLEHIDTHRSIYEVLLNAGQQTLFANEVQRLLFQCFTEHLNETAIRDREGFLVFAEVVFAGFIHFVQQYLRSQTTLTSAEIAQEISRMFVHGVQAYK